MSYILKIKNEMGWPVGALSELSSDKYGTTVIYSPTGNRGNHQGRAEHEPLVMSLLVRLSQCSYSTALTYVDQSYNSRH